MILLPIQTGIKKNKKFQQNGASSTKKEKRFFQWNMITYGNSMEKTAFQQELKKMENRDKYISTI